MNHLGCGVPLCLQNIITLKKSRVKEDDFSRMKHPTKRLRKPYQCIELHIKHIKRGARSFGLIITYHHNHSSETISNILFQGA